MENRNLTDEDVKALAKEVMLGLKSEFYSDLGKGVWGLAWKVILVVIVGLACYGYKGH